MHSTLSSRQNDSTAFWMFFALACISFLDRILLGPYAVFGYFDMLDNDFPHFVNQGKHLLSSVFYSWYPNIAGGMPSFAGQHPPYFPPSFAAAFIPLWMVSLIWSFLAVIAGGFGIYRFLKDFIGISGKIAMLCGFMGAVTYMFGNIQFTMTYCFPLFFMWTHDLCSPDIKLKNKLLRLFGLITIAATSYPVLTLPHFPIIHLFLYLAFGHNHPNFKRNIAAAFMVWTGYVLFFVPTIFSLFQYIPFAQRNWEFPKASTTVMFLDFLEVFVGKFRDNNFLSVSLLGMPLVFKNKRIRTALFFVLIPLVISSFFGAKTKALLMGTFLLKMDLFMFGEVALTFNALFAALVLDEWRKNPACIPKFWIPVALVLFLPIGSEQVMIRNIAVLCGALSLILLLRSADGFPFKRKRLALAVFCGCMAALLMFTRQQAIHGDAHVRYAQGFENHPALTKLAEEYDRTPFRVACADIHPAIAQSYGLDTIGTRGPLLNKYYKGYFKKVVEPQLSDPQFEKWFDDTWRYLMFTRERGAEFHYKLTLDGPNRSAKDWNFAMLRNLGVKYILSARPIEGIEKYATLEFIDKGEGLPEFIPSKSIGEFYKLTIYGYKLSNASGFARLASRTDIQPNDSLVLNTMGNSSESTLKDTVFFSDKDLAGDKLPVTDNSSQEGTVRIDKYNAGRIVLSGKAEGPGYIVVPVNFDAHWKAQLNGVDVKPLRADSAFLALPVYKAGSFTAELAYSTPLVWWLHIASALGLLLMLLIIRLTPSSDANKKMSTHPENRINIAKGKFEALKGGVVASVIWLAGYYFFVYLKHPDSTDPQIYQMYTTPIIGIAVSIWAERLVTAGLGRK